MNMVMLFGNIGWMSELRVIGEKQTEIVSFSLATREYYNKEHKTTWHQCKAFGARAATISKYFSKGKQIAVWGRIEVESWQDKDGNDRSKTVVVVIGFDFVGTKGERAESPEPAPAPAAQEPEPTQDGPDDGLPF